MAIQLACALSSYSTIENPQTEANFLSTKIRRTKEFLNEGDMLSMTQKKSRLRKEREPARKSD